MGIAVYFVRYTIAFVLQDELDHLSEDHAMTFMTLVNHAQRRFAEQANQFDP